MQFNFHVYVIIDSGNESQARRVIDRALFIEKLFLDGPKTDRDREIGTAKILSWKISKPLANKVR